MRLRQLTALCQEFAALLPNTRLQELRRHGTGQFSLSLYGPPRYSLWIDLQRPQSSCYLGEPAAPAEAADALTLGLRKHLLGGRLLSVEQLTRDRILRWHFATAAGSRYLMLELSGRHGNLFLLDAEQRVLQQLYRDGSRRQLQHHRTYCPPAPFTPAADSSEPLLELPPDGSRSRAVAAISRQRTCQQQQQALLLRARRRLERRLLRAHQQLERLQQDLERLDEAGRLQRHGELLQGAYGRVSPGQASVVVTDYFQPHQPSVSLALNPAWSLAENIRKSFQQARKREVAAERALAQFAPAETAAAKLQAQLDTLASWESQAGELSAETLTQLRELLPPPQVHSNQASRLPYRRFQTVSGQPLLVGRSARDNQQLTFGLARGRDLWLHVADGTGSHVIVPLEKHQAVTSETLLDAATLALHFSACAGQQQADIHYTLRKQVQKIKGGRPGQVQLASFSTLHLRLEPERLKRLLHGKDADD